MKTLESLKSTLFTAVRIVTLAVLLATAMVLQAEDFTKTYKEKYTVDQGAVLAIQNKFGDVHCQIWDERAVSVTVTITVDASSQERADKVFDKIGVQLSGTPSRVSGVTTVGNISNGDFSIDYDIRMPRWMNLDLDNKFGEIYIDETDGTAKINLEYGAMDVRGLNSDQNVLTVKFSKCEAGYVKKGKLNIEYGEWDSERVDQFQVYSRFSEITIEEATGLTIDSQYDELNLGKTGQVISVSRFSDVDASLITGDFDFDTEYGEVSVDRITSGFKQGRIRNSFAGVSLGFDPGASFTVDAELKFGDLNYPKDKSSINKEVVGYTTNMYKGRVGSGSSPQAQLSIDSRNANVTIRFTN